MHIILVEDDPQLGAAIQRALERLVCFRFPAASPLFGRLIAHASDVSFDPA